MAFRREVCLLRPVVADDLEMILEWRNSERIRLNMYTDRLITMEEHRSWFERIGSATPPSFLVFQYEGRPLGVVQFTQQDMVNSRCHWGFYIGATDAPSGAGTAMAMLAFEYAFERLKIRKLIGEALGSNEASIAYHRKLGFKEEGCFMKHVLKNGTYCDVISFALFREDWLLHKADMEKHCFGGKG